TCEKMTDLLGRSLLNNLLHRTLTYKRAKLVVVAAGDELKIEGKLREPFQILQHFTGQDACSGYQQPTLLHAVGHDAETFLNANREALDYSRVDTSGFDMRHRQPRLQTERLTQFFFRQDLVRQ